MSDPDGFTPLERAAIEAICAETPDLVPRLRRQLRAATVTGRENTGGGFYTDILVPEAAEPVEATHLGQETWAHVDGLQYGLGFVLFLKNGRMTLLDTYSQGGEDTSALRPAELSFRIDRRSFRD